MSESADTATAGPAKQVQSAGIEHGYPHGHLNHLNEQEEAALKNFKLFLTEKQLYKAGPPPSHDDQTLLRFLRARRWVVQDAFKQFKDTEDWRAANHLDVLYDTIDVESYEQSRRLYPQWTGRRDKRGIPLYVFEIRHLDSKTIAHYEKTANETYSKVHSDGKTPPKLLRLFALYENLTRFVQPMCTEMRDRENNETPITLSTNIVDVSAVSLRQFWNLKAHMQAASQLATAHYPETLDRIFIIGAPFFFPTVWGWIKRWFDPITVSKIFILGHNEVLPTLKSFIDMKHIPKSYGGELEWGWGDRPSLDPAIRAVVTWENGFTDFPDGPVYWRPVDGDRYECIAVGSVKQVERLQRVCTMPKSYVGQLAALPGVFAAPPPSGEANGQPPEVAAAAAAAKSEDASGPDVAGQPAADAPVVTTGVETGATETKTEAVAAQPPTVAEVPDVGNLTLSGNDDAASKQPVSEVSEKVAATSDEVPAPAAVA